MASSINNWVHEKGNVTDKDRMALERAKKIEKNLKKNGYRWIKINERLQTFVPCDENGKPTLEGERKIAMLKESQNIK
jgi:hypothetical protein